MRCEVVFLTALALLSGSGCASSKTKTWGRPAAIDEVAAASYLAAYDRGAQRFQLLAWEYEQKHGRDPLLIEAEEMVAVSEELSVLSEARLALEILEQAMRLLEGGPTGEKTPQ